MVRLNCILLCIFLAFVGISVLQADDPPPSPFPVIANEFLYVSRLVRVSTSNGTPVLGNFGVPAGTDPLSSGAVAVRRDRQVGIEIKGAQANTSYSAMFCRFGFPAASGCISLGGL